MPIARIFTPRSSPRRIDLSPPESQPDPPDERTDQFELEVDYTRRSLARTNGMVSSALSLACIEHAARPGEHCWPGARGICTRRIRDGLAFVDPYLNPGELEPFTAATRRAQHRHGNRS